jgi:hypothetical protein
LPEAAPTPVPGTPTAASAQPSQSNGVGLDVWLLGQMHPRGLFSSQWDLGNDDIGVVAGLLGGGQARFTSEGSLVFENVHGDVGDTLRSWASGGQNAVTVGHVILNTTVFPKSNPFWLAHESAHVRQSEVLGPFYLLAYGALLITSGGPAQHDAHPMEDQANRYGVAFSSNYVWDSR